MGEGFSNRGVKPFILKDLCASLTITTLFGDPKGNILTLARISSI